MVAHTAASRRLAESEMLKMIVGLSVDEVWPAQARVRFPIRCFKAGLMSVDCWCVE